VIVVIAVSRVFPLKQQHFERYQQEQWTGDSAQHFHGAWLQVLHEAL